MTRRRQKSERPPSKPADDRNALLRCRQMLQIRLSAHLMMWLTCWLRRSIRSVGAIWTQKTSNSVAYLTGHLLRALELSNLQSRLDALEASLQPDEKSDLERQS